MQINYEDFKKVQILVGTIISVKINEKSRDLALLLDIDFGDKIGTKISSAKITDYYNSASGYCTGEFNTDSLYCVDTTAPDYTTCNDWETSCVVTCHGAGGD